MTLAVMTRATLGHTGQPLKAGIATQLIYALIAVSAILRIAAALIGSLDLIEGAAVCWLLGFALFVLAYGRLLILRKPAWAAPTILSHAGSVTTFGVRTDPRASTVSLTPLLDVEPGDFRAPSEMRC